MSKILTCLHLISIRIIQDVQTFGVNMGLLARKPVFGVSAKASFKPISSATETIARTLKFTCIQFTYDSFQKENNKGAGWSAPLLFANK